MIINFENHMTVNQLLCTNFKIHKYAADNNNVFPSHPILFGICTCNYNLAKFFEPILTQFRINKYIFKDSFFFCQEILDQDWNLFIASFDIQSLFIHILLDEKLDLCVDKVFEKRKKVKGMLKRHFKPLLILLVLFSMVFFTNKLMRLCWALLWDKHKQIYF